MYAQRVVDVSVDSVVFAIIGDYGDHSIHEQQVAAMVHSWQVDFIITTGDNNYPWGRRSTLRRNILQYYGDYIYNPDAPARLRTHGRADSTRVNRFFPCPGNHDHYSSRKLKPYRSCFTLPGDELNYNFRWGPIDFYSINSKLSGHVPCCDSTPASWLKQQLGYHTDRFKLVYFHHPPYSPGEHGSATDMQWPFAAWGVDAVLCGHEHFYARILDKSTQGKPLYIISGNAGNTRLYGCDAHPLDTARYDMAMCDAGHWGAIKARANSTSMILEYYRVDSPQYPTDVYILPKPAKADKR
jgi:tartrate-resistant acid phosphatase type 5